MSQLLVGCPLCCQATFSSTNALCIALITVASKTMKCPLCEEVLCGLDKLTIHLLSHLLIHPSDQFVNQVNGISTFNLTKQKKLNEKQIVPGVKFIDEEHKCYEMTSSQFLNIAKQSGNNKENASRPIDDICQAQNIMVDDEVMLVFDKNIKQNEQNQECSSRNFIFSSDNNENHLKSIKPDELHPNMPGFLLLNNVQSVKDNFTCDIPQSDATAVVSELNGVKTSEYYIQSAKSLVNLEHSVSKDGTVFRKINKLDQLNFGNQTDVLDYSLKLTGNLTGTALTVDKTKINFCNFGADLSAQKTSCHDDLCNSPVNDTSLSSGSFVGLQCSKCPVTFVDRKMMSVHQELAHSSENSDEKKKLFSCKLCTKSFKMKGSLVVHIKVAHSTGPTALSKLLEAAKKTETPSVGIDVTPYICSLCGKGFKKEQHLVQHEKTHEGKQWECDVCTKTFTTKYFLKKHHLLHTGETPYTCATCNKSFTFQQSYHKHLLYHSDDKPYQCTECGRSFKELSTLHNHQRIHTGEKPYSCETCGKCFRQRVSYLVHRRIHTGDMPYRCFECNKSFRYKVSERTHKCSSNISLVTHTDNSESLLPSSQKVNNTTKSTEDGLPCSRRENTVCSELPAQDWLELPYSVTNKDTALASNNYVESADFFSMIMSPTCQYASDKLENLRLSPDNSMKWSGEKSDLLKNEDKLESDVIGNVCQDSLKELLYSVGDYS